MDELVIKCHDFENAKKSIKDFSEDTNAAVELKKVNEKKGLGEWLGDAFRSDGMGLTHKVTGKELNELTIQIQSHLHSVNNTQIKIIKEFGQVYTALEALDKDYIQAILISIKATEKTSKRIEATQEQIKKIVEDQKKTLEVLKKFKQKLEHYAHLGDIDKIWNDFQKWNKEISSLSASISGTVEISSSNAKKIKDIEAFINILDDKVTGLDEYLKEQIHQIGIISEFIERTERLNHLEDIDEMWESLTNVCDSLENIRQDISILNEKANKQQEEIKDIFKFVSVVSAYEHLSDIDAIWKTTKRQEEDISALNQKHNDSDTIIKEQQDMIAELAEYKGQLLDIQHLTDVDKLWEVNESNADNIKELYKQKNEIKNEIQDNKQFIESAYAKMKEENSLNLQALANKIKYAYFIAGGALGLALVELIIILIKVI